ncbi:TetR/AcrR family transcriptional regulator [Streptomyces sp. 2A115]|uniref:TetR/AcrR family transcriptional regulator n=1 Tax=Streptomyces sp. 2A115 TaxID=3457439 RepID=UPI003FD1EB7F
MATTSGTKAGYHHGDLRNALVAAAVDLASEGGPERVVLREAARRVGVSPTAAYRHFDGQGDLLHAVKVRGQTALADFMAAFVAKVPDVGDPGEAAVLRLSALGRGYIRFALERPGLFRAAFCRIPDEPGEPTAWAGVSPAGPEPQYSAFNLLTATLDEVVATGRMPAENRPGAEGTAWATVHGLALLMLDGPLARLSVEQRDAMVERSLATLTAGLTAGGDLHGLHGRPGE